MGILTRFKDIMSSNVNALLDKMEDPEKMIDQYLRNMEKDLNTVKSETAAVMATETAAKRRLNECKDEISKMENYAKKALQAGNETDARIFLEKKSNLSSKLETFQKDYEISSQNATQMREMHDKLVSDIQKLSDKRNEIKTKIKMAKTAEKMSKLGSSAEGVRANISAFDKIEEKANRMLDEANAKLELNTKKSDDIDDLMKKYDTDTKSLETNNEVDDELERMKKELGL